ncbi:MAG: LysM peptidoglycan-binding domain-containing protein [Spirochaetaceae bacterium]|nr:MAG: LysM peptidoglycan-binding domain-containing protein [Spirochaetaceae bacterium]
MSVNLNGKLGIKTEQGQIVPVLDLRTQKWNQTVFTTIADGQKKAMFPFYYKNESNTQWVYLDSLPLERIPSAPAGIPDLTLKVRVDEQGKLSLSFRSSDTVSPSRVQPEPRRKMGIGPVLLVLALLAVLTGLYFFLIRPRTGLTLPAGRPDQISPRQSSKVEQSAAPASAAVTTRPSQPELQRNLSTQAEEAAVPSTDLDSGWGKPAGESNDELIFLETGERYQITWGDTLWRISERFYGDRDLYPILAERNQLDDPDYIISGESLGLPSSIGGRERLSSPLAD